MVRVPNDCVIRPAPSLHVAFVHSSVMRWDEFVLQWMCWIEEYCCVEVVSVRKFILAQSGDENISPDGRINVCASTNIYATAWKLRNKWPLYRTIVAQALIYLFSFHENSVAGGAWPFNDADFFIQVRNEYPLRRYKIWWSRIPIELIRILKSNFNAFHILVREK